MLILQETGCVHDSSVHGIMNWKGFTLNFARDRMCTDQKLIFFS